MMNKFTEFYLKILLANYEWVKYVYIINEDDSERVINSYLSAIDNKHPFKIRHYELDSDGVTIKNTRTTVLSNSLLSYSYIVVFEND